VKNSQLKRGLACVKMSQQANPQEDTIGDMVEVLEYHFLEETSSDSEGVM